MHSITERGVLVSMTISQWGAEKLDKKVTQEVSELHQSDVAMGKFQKFLINRAPIKRVKSVASRVYSFHIKNTLPWADGGLRILPVENIFEYREKLGELITTFNTEVNELISQYEGYMAEAKEKLNGLFNPTDYPTVSELKDKFGISISISPIPDGDDFRITIDAEEIEKMKNDLTVKQNEAVEAAMKDIWNRLYGAVERIVSTLPKFNPAAENRRERGSFHESMISNLVDICELLPKLNIAQDANLDSLCSEVMNKVVLYSAKELREDDDARKRTADEAEKILEQMSKYIGV